MLGCWGSLVVGVVVGSSGSIALISCTRLYANTRIKLDFNPLHNNSGICTCWETTDMCMYRVLSHSRVICEATSYNFGVILYNMLSPAVGGLHGGEGVVVASPWAPLSAFLLWKTGQ